MNLLPCPFCGSDKIFVDNYVDMIWNLTCINCNAINIMESSYEEAVKKYNTRHTPWISVKDRLPNNYQECLCYARSRDGSFHSIVQCQYEFRNENYMDWAVKLFCEGNYYVLLEKGQIQNPEREGHFYFGEVTHWMPLPPLPEEKP